jgi:autotransporter-associated beta strand protein
VNGIVNNDDNTQTFNVPIKLTSNTGIAGAGAAMTWNAAAGNMVFDGNNNAVATPWTVNLNGASALTIDGSFNVTIGVSGPGQIVNTNVGTTSGFIKNGSGTLTLGGTAANTYVGTNKINAGTVMAAKANAFGSGNALILAGGTFNSGGLNQALGTLDMDGTATIDFGAGTSAMSFANSSLVNWGSFTLNLLDWTSGSDTLRVGTDATGLTASQLNQIVFSDLPGSPTAQIDANGFVTPIQVPEPTGLAFGFLALVGLCVRIRRYSGVCGE